MCIIMHMSHIVAAQLVAIGALGKMQRLPRFINDQVEEVDIMQISCGGDHWVVDRCFESVDSIRTTNRRPSAEETDSYCLVNDAK
jgi:hypothetical protein